MIRFVDVSHSYDGHTVMEAFQFSLPEQGRIALLGPSGCGKTTLLRLLAGMEQPEHGHIEGMQGMRVSCVFQEPRLLPWKNARDNIACLLTGLSLKEARRQADEWLERVELSDSKEKFPHECSGGMKQRISIARALAVPSDVMLLDEPMRGLDPALQTRMKELFLEYSGRLTLLVTHDRREAEGFAQEICTFQGSPLTLISRAAL